MAWFKKRSEDTEKYSRLEDAERESQSLSERAKVAIRYLEERQGRNHWRESIQTMIQGGSV